MKEENNNEEGIEIGNDPPIIVTQIYCNYCSSTKLILRGFLLEENSILLTCGNCLEEFNLQIPEEFTGQELDKYYDENPEALEGGEDEK